MEDSISAAKSDQEVVMSAPLFDDWRQLSEAASKEQDPEKLMRLVVLLNEVLKRREDTLRAQRHSAPPN